MKPQTAFDAYWQSEIEKRAARPAASPDPLSTYRDQAVAVLRKNGVSSEGIGRIEAGANSPFNEILLTKKGPGKSALHEVLLAAHCLHACKLLEAARDRKAVIALALSIAESSKDMRYLQARAEFQRKGTSAQGKRSAPVDKFVEVARKEEGKLRKKFKRQPTKRQVHRETYPLVKKKDRVEYSAFAANFELANE